MGQMMNNITDKYSLEDGAELDEDLIRGYKCIKCGCMVCKDEVFKHIRINNINSFNKVICLDCGLDKFRTEYLKED